MKDSGYTFIESLIGGILFSLIGLAMIIFFSVSVKGSTKAERKSISATTAKNFDFFLRDALAKVSPPFWVRKLDMTFTPGSFSVNYVNSKQQDYLIIDKSINGSSISLPEKYYSFNGIEIIDIKLIESHEKNMGISVEYVIDNNKFVSSALFSSFPIGENDD